MFYCVRTGCETCAYLRGATRSSQLNGENQFQGAVDYQMLIYIQDGHLLTVKSQHKIYLYSIFIAWKTRKKNFYKREAMKMKHILGDL